MLKLNKYWLVFLALFAFLIFIIGFMTRIIGTINYTQFSGDQARDSTVIQRFWSGYAIGYGPESSVGNYKLPPLYFYLLIPITVFGTDPVLTALPNAILSMATIFLVGYLIFKILDKTSFNVRVIISLICSFWWSVMWGDVILNNMSWNPSPVPFF